MLKRKPVVGVMGGSTATEGTRKMAFELGALVATRGWVLLNGGRNRGVMAASAKGARAAGGLVIGVLPDRSATKASPDLDVAIVTGMGDARNAINVLSSDVIVACPGGLGTLSEVVLGLKAGKRVILLGWDLPHDAERALRLQRFRRSGQLTTTSHSAEAVEQAAAAFGDISDKP